MKPRPTAVIAGAAVLALASSLAVGYAARPDEPDQLAIVGDARWPSGSVEAWVTYGEHVVVVEPITVLALPPDRSEVENGEGLTMREADLEVREVLWSRDPVEHRAPEKLTWTLLGSSFRDGDLGDRTPAFMPGRSSIRMGHTYVAVIAMVPARCDEVSRVEAHWEPLGEGAVLPFDEGVLGRGEFEGSIVTTEEIKRIAPQSEFIQQIAGFSAPQLSMVFSKTPPEEFDLDYERQTNCE